MGGLVPNFFKRRNRTMERLETLKKVVEVNLRTYESKIQTVQGAFETLKQQNEKIIMLLEEIKNAKS